MWVLINGEVREASIKVEVCKLISTYMGIYYLEDSSPLLEHSFICLWKSLSSFIND